VACAFLSVFIRATSWLLVAFCVTHSPVHSAAGEMRFAAGETPLTPLTPGMPFPT
jgi:hypothetical protein